MVVIRIPDQQRVAQVVSVRAADIRAVPVADTGVVPVAVPVADTGAVPVAVPGKVGLPAD